jgi:hypothetical protein
MQTLPALRTRTVTAVTHPGAWLAETRTRQGRVPPQSSSSSAAAAGATTLPTIAVAVSGRRQRRPLQSARKGSAATRMAFPHACRHPNRPQLVYLPNRRNWARAGATWLEAAASLRLRPRRNPPSVHPAPVGRLRGGLLQQWASPNPVVPGRRWYSPSHPSPNTPTPLLPNHSQSPFEGITDLFDNLPTSACVELTRRLLSTASSPPTGDARPRAVLKTVIIFLPENGGAA